MFFFFWQPVYYLLDATEQTFLGTSKEMRARWTGVDENVWAKKCWKLVGDVSREIIYRSIIYSAIEAGTNNPQVDPLELKQTNLVELIDTDEILDNFMSLANFDTPLLHTTKLSPVDSMPVSTKSQTW